MNLKTKQIDYEEQEKLQPSCALRLIQHIYKNIHFHVAVNKRVNLDV